ncbi:photosystem II protein PsbQ [Dolichospermum compactum]|uniref:Photosystem II protein PsbQ n=1 Tax=Dolichospermum compactum NIES-806 TaxID=1973481 RepID=A0A1Z4UYK8_9CYAN|nr:photosystem II protein PsbQ [Dolichospermum compactum]BAZ84336.1 photosystem II protein PsbQ [Dolichospermum compactum NIES-806]
MVRQRSIFSLIFVLLATFLISCGSPTVATVPPSYTAAEVAKIQEYVPGIQMVRDRSSELQNLIKAGEWVKVGNFIHGPMTEARLNMTYIIPNLAKQSQAQARQISKDLLKDLVRIDQAAAAGNTSLAASKYQEAFADIDKFLELVPEKSS